MQMSVQNLHDAIEVQRYMRPVISTDTRENMLTPALIHNILSAGILTSKYLLKCILSHSVNEFLILTGLMALIHFLEVYI